MEKGGVNKHGVGVSRRGEEHEVGVSRRDELHKAGKITGGSKGGVWWSD